MRNRSFARMFGWVGGLVAPPEARLRPSDWPQNGGRAQRWRSPARLAGIAAAGLLLAACAVTARPVELDPGELEAEAKLQKELAVESRLGDQRRLQSVAFRVLTAAADFCRTRTAPLYGIAVASKHSFGESMQGAAETRLKLDDRPRILAVAAGSPAEKAGLLPGDEILRVGAVAVEPGEEAHRAVVERLREAGMERTRLELGGKRPRTVTVRPVPACDYRVALLPRGNVNAYTNGRTITVTKGMMWFARDDKDLALVLSHEVAHNILGHTNPLAVAFVEKKRREADADYLGLYIMARAGYRIDQAPAFWRRVATAFPQLIDESDSHPVMPYRFVALRKAGDEIRRRRAAGLPLNPERIESLGIPRAVE